MPLQVLVYLKVHARTKITGRKPENEFSARPLPDPAAYSMVYPKVRTEGLATAHLALLSLDGLSDIMHARRWEQQGP